MCITCLLIESRTTIWLHKEHLKPHKTVSFEKLWNLKETDEKNWKRLLDWHTEYKLLFQTANGITHVEPLRYQVKLDVQEVGETN